MKGNHYGNERMALFIDGANLYSATRALGFDIDPPRLLKGFRDRGHLVRASYYTALPDDKEKPADPAADRLAGLQRLRHGHQAGQGIHRCQGPPQARGPDSTTIGD